MNSTINHAAVTEHHHKETQAPAGGTDGNGTVTAPINLGAFAGGKLQHQEGGLAHRAHQADKLLEDAVAAGVALGFEFLQHLLGGVTMALQQSHDLPFEGVELAGPFGSLTRPVAELANPPGHRLGVQLQFGGDLGDAQVLLISQLAQPPKGGVINHGAPPLKARRRMSATDCVCPLRGSVGAVGSGDSSGRASTW